MEVSVLSLVGFGTLPKYCERVIMGLGGEESANKETILGLCVT